MDIYVKDNVERVANTPADAVKLSFDGYRLKKADATTGTNAAERDAGAPKVVGKAKSN